MLVVLILVAAAPPSALANPSVVGDQAGSAPATGPAPAAALPFTFFFTHYELLGNPGNPVGVRAGGGRYTTSNPAGAITTRGTWRVTGFTSFKKLPGWWGIPGFKEEGWQGPPGSASFSGFLTLTVRLEKLGEGGRGV